MKLHFTFLLAVAALALVGWTIINYVTADYAQGKLDELTSYPLMAYVPDSTAAQALSGALVIHPAVDSIRIQSGMDASREVIESHSLNIMPDLLAKFNLPDIVHIHLNSAHQMIGQRDSLLALIGEYVHADDIESHPALWKKIIGELHQIKRYSLYLNGFIALLMLLLVTFMRLNYENLQVRLRPYRKRTVVDEMREKRTHIRHIVLMLFIPPTLSPLLYYILLYLNKISVFLDWWIFGLQLIVFIIASIIVIISEKTYEQAELLRTDEPAPTPYVEPDGWDNAASGSDETHP